jgi:transcriptional regulator with GAF, ATPase, and Fis domain
MTHIQPGDAAGFAEVARELLAEPRFELTLQRVVDVAAESIPGCDFAGVSLRHDGTVSTPASSDPLVDELDQAQYDLQEGPCLDAIWVEDIYRINDMAHEQRWPNWAPRAAAAGVNSVLSVRLATPAEVVGGLNMYSRKVNAFDDEALVTAHIYATHASSALAVLHEVDGLQTALQSRHTIGMAQGLLMHRYGLDEHSSFQVMRRLSSHQNVKLRDIAARVIDEFNRTGSIA